MTAGRGGVAVGEEPGAGRAPDPRPRSDRAQRARSGARPKQVLTRVMNMRRARDYACPGRQCAKFTCSRWARAARQPSCTSVEQRGSADRAAGRGRRASRRLPHARTPSNIMHGRERLNELGVPQLRRGRPVLFPQPLFPRAERHPVRDRDRRPRLRHRRADGSARREAGAAAVPGTAPRRDRGGVEAAGVERNLRRRAQAILSPSERRGGRVPEGRSAGGLILSIVSPCFGQTGMECGQDVIDLA